MNADLEQTKEAYHGHQNVIRKRAAVVRYNNQVNWKIESMCWDSEVWNSKRCNWDQNDSCSSTSCGVCVGQSQSEMWGEESKYRLLDLR